ncbi:DUF2309 domain-containing protein [Myxococcus sp. K38C18041901]|uniref:DUF2309 domain-containing protein n=1 Tax=Myxococcus guangdongensis TaxID=2906760 RepID=UPI0020A7019F|nr:DUF2309 domain-containing protein [Myxococcus guangdongensis]MCP3064637.1 DUF2309 domain-containing protein [Myxococcus guangdongensis]
MSHAPASVATEEDRGLRAALARASQVLPVQGPLSVFVHHNPLHTLQHLPFHEALAAARATLGAEGYLSEARFLELYRQGRITDEDLRAVLAEWEHTLHEAPSGSRLEVARLALLHPVEHETDASLRWKLEECCASRRLRADLPSTARQVLLERALPELRADLDRVGRGWTMTQLACALLGIDLDPVVRATSSTLPYLLPRSIALRRLGIPAALASAYVDGVSTRLAGSPGVTVDAWLSAEALRVTEALASALGGDGSLGSLRARLEKSPEPFVASALWSASHTPTPPRALPSSGVLSHREWLRAATGEDVNDLLHPHLIRVCAAFLDEGLSAWPLPAREQGLHAAWRAQLREGLGVAPDWLEVEWMASSPGCAQDTVLAALEGLGVAEPDWEAYLARVLLALPGWAGMVHRLEQHPEDRPEGAPPARLMDFLAVRLTLERSALRDVARRRLGYTGPLSGLEAVARAAIDPLSPPEQEGRWRLFHQAQLLGWSPMEVRALPVSTRQEWLRWLDGFDVTARQRVWQEAYEHHYRMEVSRALARNHLRPSSARTVTAPRFQVLLCMDDREESLRRHFEEQDARHETFGIAGFFGVAFDYRGLDDASHVAQCPVAVTPAHVIEEHASPEHHSLAETRSRRRTLWARLGHVVHQGTHAMETSWFLVPWLGLLSLPRLSWNLLFPRVRARLRQVFARRALPHPRTHLASLRASEPVEARHALKPRGFTLDEKAARVAASLESMGLVESFAPWVVLLGHGSVSVNNPHQAAYDCGACGGRHGGPNARLFAEMANRPEVRARLRERGIRIPDSTWFVGGMHDTTTDQVHLYDTEVLPATHRTELTALREALDRARALSAQERCRRFESAPLGLSASAALRHVEARAEDLGQPRPELGHATIAGCIVGRRALTRGLFLDRRVFLISYDPTRDEDGAIIERILLAAGPVGAGISLEYYFSHVDNERHGCGTKLPHNITGLLGVMDGAGGDLRTGLPRQMIEIHEPLRLLLFVEASTVTLSRILARQPALHELIHHQWVQLVSVDPVTGEQRRYTPRGFEPLLSKDVTLPEVASSIDWYRGHRDPLGPALVHGPAHRTHGASRGAAHVSR